jgi:ADP-heptose:LPS heptosyltransferase
VQLHGGGRFSNPFLLQLEARHTVGMATPDAVALERTVPYRYYQHETMRALEVAAAAGAQPVSLEAVLDVRECEFTAAAAILPPGDAPLLVIHPGASDPRRRWPADRFAEVAASAAAAGARVVVVGDESEAELAACVVGMAGAGAGAGARAGADAGARAAARAGADAGAGTVTSLAGRLTLGELAGVFAHAEVVLANDSGPRHLAQAVGTATVGIYWIGNLINAGPLTRSDHRVELSWTTHCPVCGVDVTQATGQRCPHDVSFVADVPASAVEADVAELMARSRLLRG